MHVSLTQCAAAPWLHRSSRIWKKCFIQMKRTPLLLSVLNLSKSPPPSLSTFSSAPSILNSTISFHAVFTLPVSFPHFFVFLNNSLLTLKSLFFQIWLSVCLSLSECLSLSVAVGLVVVCSTPAALCGWPIEAGARWGSSGCVQPSERLPLRPHRFFRSGLLSLPLGPLSLSLSLSFCWGGR